MKYGVTDMKRHGYDTLTALAGLLLAAGTCTAEQSGVWALDPSSIPLPPSSQEMVLYVQDQTMGAGDQRWGEPQTKVDIPPQIVLAPTAEAKAASALHDYYLVRIPFTLHQLPNGRRYHSFKLAVKLDTGPAIAYRLIPDQVVTSEDTQKVWDISAVVGPSGLNLGGKVSRVVSLRQVRPVVRSFGEGSPYFYWTFDRQESAPPLLGSENAFVILRVAKGSESVAGELRGQAVADGRFPWPATEELESKPQPFAWELKSAERIGAMPFDVDRIGAGKF